MYNKWFPEFEEKQVVFSPQSTAWGTYSNKFKLLARIMKLTEQSDYEEVELKKIASGVQRPFFVLCH